MQAAVSVTPHSATAQQGWQHLHSAQKALSLWYLVTFPAKHSCWLNHRHGFPQLPRNKIHWHTEEPRESSSVLWILWHTANTGLYTKSFFPQTCPGFAQHQEPAGGEQGLPQCWAISQGLFSQSREILVLQQPLGLQEVETEANAHQRIPEPKHFPLYPHPPNLGYSNVIPDTGIPNIVLWNR